VNDLTTKEQRAVRTALALPAAARRGLGTLARINAPTVKPSSTRAVEGHTRSSQSFDGRSSSLTSHAQDHGTYLWSR
jgi:hypothetical protein